MSYLFALVSLVENVLNFREPFLKKGVFGGLNVPHTETLEVIQFKTFSSHQDFFDIN